MQRKLTVIFSADVVGYSAMMERDEAGTLERLKANRRAIFDPRVAAHGGRLVKLMGDGALVEFSSAVSAIACAHEIQEAMDEAEPDLPEGDRIRWRIGINLGDVIVEGEDIYGDGVNVAARLQTLAPPGGVALSGAVRDQALGKIGVQFADIGEHAMKNIARPVHVFLIGDGEGATPKAKSTRVCICVLPFVNMSGDPEQEYFSDGVTEDITTDLSKVSALSVISRNTAFTFKGKPTDVSQIARALRVTHVLEGSVRKAGARVRITAQLVDAAADSHIWAERYDRDLTDIFALQAEISEAIVAALKLRLAPAEKQAIEQRSTTNPEAYKLYLMARQYAFMANERHYPIVLRLCRRAVEIDPNYARAWALMTLSIWDLNRRSITVDDGSEAAERALALDPNLAEAHAAMAAVHHNHGRFEEELAACERALALDPNCYEAMRLAGFAALALRRFDAAIRYYEAGAAAIETEFYCSGMVLQCYETKGDEAGAECAARRLLERVEKIIAAEPDHGTAMGFGASALATLNEPERARDWTERALLLDPDNTNLRYNLMCGMIRLGETETALGLLKDVLESAAHSTLHWIERDSDLDPIRDHPRFKELVAARKTAIGS
ncbi:MAG: adenylate/guanylate cyclase domain-containing protein [Hyphomonadaceae bacterium]|nr:adenylate/guanylate cyclase domain-containing protein [Hyphomonadaceae bacterium]